MHQSQNVRVQRARHLNAVDLAVGAGFKPALGRQARALASDGGKQCFGGGLIVRRVHAFNPFPGASTHLLGEPLKIWSASVGAGVPPPGAVFGSILTLSPDSIHVAAMNSVVSITELQRSGGKRLKAADFLHGFGLRPGMVFEKRAS